MEALALGVAHEVFWDSTLAEIMALIDRIQERAFEREKAATLRAGMVAAEVRNTLRQKTSDRVWRARDFVSDPPAKLSPEQMQAAMNQWAAAINHHGRA